MKEKRWEILSFYTSVQKSWSYAILFVRYGAWCMYLLVFILGYFLPFYPPSLTIQKLKISKKWEKIPGDMRYHHCTEVYQKSGLYVILFLRYGARQVWLLFCILGYFLLFYPLTAQRTKILKKWKKSHGDIIILHSFTKNYDHMLYCSWDMAHGRCNCYFSFWAVFCPLTPLTAQKIKISKKKKETLRYIIILHICTKNYD